MNPPLPCPDSAAPVWRRLHQALLPDYNRKATAFWWTMVIAGACVIAAGVFVLSIA